MKSDQTHPPDDSSAADLFGSPSKTRRVHVVLPSATAEPSALNSSVDNELFHETEIDDTERWSATPSKQPAQRARRTGRRSSILHSSRTLLMWACLLLLILFTGRQLQYSSRVLDIGRKSAQQLLREILPDLNSEKAASTSKAKGTPPREDARTLALLYPPGLLGGYRNQVMRFIAFVTYAKKNNMSQLLLNSLLWSTQLDGIGVHITWFPIPFDWIFDVDYWNTFDSDHHLPGMVRDNQLELNNKDKGTCWTKSSEIEGQEMLQNAKPINRSENSSASPQIMYAYEHAGQTTTINHLQRAALLQGTLTPLMRNVSVPFITGQLKIKPRRVNFLPATEHCQQPYVYGGGTAAGNLWNDYLGFHKGLNAAVVHRNSSSVPFETDVWIYRALRPAPQWRALADQCVAQHAPTQRYMALHARVELEIMGHKCGNSMEKNLTTILERVYQLQEDLKQQQEDAAKEQISGLFVAVSRAGMEEKGTKTYQKFKHFADENLRTLDIVTGHSGDNTPTNNNPQLFKDIQQNLPVFECGEQILKDYYASHPDVPNHGALLNSVINFHIAISADVFVGVKDSSYSTDVLTTRYWLGKGEANYRYTQTGIERVRGLPQPHGNCYFSNK